VDKPKVEKRIPISEVKRLRTLRIKALARQGKTWDAICVELNASKTTVMHTLNAGHRSRKRK
jgi:hypothetical protein